MEENYISKYSGEQVDAAVEYFLRHSQTTDDSSYTYTSTIFCSSNTPPAPPFDGSRLPLPMPTEYPIIGTDSKQWLDVPNNSNRNWYSCVLKINKGSNKVVSQGAVVPISGQDGSNGSGGANGQDGQNGQDGDKGDRGNYIEFRYKRLTQYAATLTESLASSRNPLGWVTDPQNAYDYTYEQIKVYSSIILDTYLCRNFTNTATPLGNAVVYFTDTTITSYEHLRQKFYILHNVNLNVTDLEIKNSIYETYKKIKQLYNKCVGNTILLVDANIEYHKLYTKYIDEDHVYLLFMIQATIDGEHDTLITNWSNPTRIQGEDGKDGPRGSNGIDGIPGVNIGVAFAIGDEVAYHANPPQGYSYTALTATGTGWYKNMPSVSIQYPYVWVTHCRYNIVNNNYVLEDAWSDPKRYTGTNGISETKVVRNPILYPAGVFTLNTTYTNDGTRTPYVYYDGSYYYLADQCSYTSDNENSNPKNSSVWQIMEHFEALYTKVGIIANGLIGSAVFNGDYMFSQQGVDNDGEFSTHYENFKLGQNGEELTNPYDSRALFKPNLCINFRTGELVNQSIENKLNAQNDAIETLSTKIDQSAEAITLEATKNVEGNLQTAGLTITSEGVDVHGKFTGDMDGTFNGTVSAKSLQVVNENGTPVIVFDTYKEALGSPKDNSTIEEGTPVLVINHNGKRFILSMVQLVTSSGVTAQYNKINYQSKTLRIATSISRSVGEQGTPQYTCITTTPKLQLVTNNGESTSVYTDAVLYDTDGTTKLDWKNYLNKYFTGTLISEYTDKTDLGNGVWAFKLNHKNFANAYNIYNGIPSRKPLAIRIKDFGLNKYLFYADTAYIYNKISLTAGVLSETLSNIVVSGDYRTYFNGNKSNSQVAYLHRYNTSCDAYQILGATVSKEVTTSSYFMTLTQQATEVTSGDITLSNRIFSKLDAPSQLV